MGQDAKAKGILRFSVPDESVPASERSFFATPQNKDYVLQEVDLHSFPDSTEVIHGPAGLDVQGFTFLKHHSHTVALGEDVFYYGNTIEEKYIPEVEQLIEDITGCKKAVAWSGGTRRKLPVKQDGNPKVAQKKGGEMDKIFDAVDRKKVFISGKSLETSIEPVRNVHIDMSNKGLRDTVRNVRRDIREAAKAALEAEDAGLNENDIPRYACYSVWRPLRTVKRDPLAACDFRTVSPSSIYDAEYRNPADNEKGEFMNTVRIILPPETPVQQKWYYYPNQTPEDVLILKIGDTGADKDPKIVMGAPHASPKLIGSDDVEEARCSIEVRIFAFW